MYRFWYMTFVIILLQEQLAGDIMKPSQTGGFVVDGLEPKKLAVLRMLQILQTFSDEVHPLMQKEIAAILERDYGIVLDRKTISRNLSLLKEAGYEIESGSNGCYLAVREFEDSELHMLIDSVLCSKHITAKHSKDLIEKLCALSNRHFKKGIKNVHCVEEWNKTENPNLFLNIELIDAAIESGRQLSYDYNKYGTDKKLHKSSWQTVSPYRMLLHNQHYYLMAYSEYWERMVFHRLDRMTNMKQTDKPAKKLQSIPGYEKGIDYKDLTSARPYLYTDKAERIGLVADKGIIDQMIDWFGKEIKIEPLDEENVKVSLMASPKAMEHWAMQYIDYVEVVSPKSLRSRIKQMMTDALQKYSD